MRSDAAGNGCSGSRTAAKIFPIDSRSYKYNPVIIEKGGSTEVIQTAFMRREPWRTGNAPKISRRPTLARR